MGIFKETVMKTMLERKDKRIKELEGELHSLRAALMPLSHLLISECAEEQIDPNWMFRIKRDEEDADLIGQDIINAKRALEHSKQVLQKSEST